MINYKSAGVDIDKGNRFSKKIKELVQILPKDGIISSIGGFSSLFELNRFDCDIVLSSTTDGVGTKLKVAQMAGIHDTVGIDLVAMNVNDIITSGTVPLFFLDYIAYSELEDNVLIDIMKGIIEGLKESKCTLVGGETAQMPSMYKKGEYDLAGFCVGVGKREELLPKRLEDGMVILGFESSGFHSNGYSLLRKLFFELGGYNIDSIVLGRSVAEILLEPTRIYVKLFGKIKPFIKAAAHITGGGFYDNIPRILDAKFDAIIEKNSLPKIDIFEFIKELGNINEYEMYRTFNMGIGFVVIADKKDIEKIEVAANEKLYKIGYIEKGKGEVKIV